MVALKRVGSLTVLLALVTLLTGCAGAGLGMIELPVEHNTPDGMTLAANGNIMLSCPNFNFPEHPAYIMQITPDNKLEKFFELPVHPETKRACPLGIAFGIDGNLYIADSQALGGAEGRKSRLLKLTIKDGKPVKCECVVDGFMFSNAVASWDDTIYVTETALDTKPGEGPHRSGVYAFKLDELDGAKPITLIPDGKDPHLVCTLTTKNEKWKVGANGMGFAPNGTMYVCNFGDAQLIAVKRGIDGKAISQTVVAEGGPMLSCDGMKVCAKSGMIFIADFLGNAVHKVCPKSGKVTTIAQNGLTTGANGELDRCSEVCLRNGKIYAANIDLELGEETDPNKKDVPYSVSIITMEK